MVSAGLPSLGRQTMSGQPFEEKMISAQGLKLFVREQGDGHPLL